MVANVRIYHTYDEYARAERSWKAIFTNALETFQTQVKNIQTIFSAIKCGMKWGEYVSPNAQFYSAIKGGRKEIKQMTDPLVLSSTAKAAYKVYQNSNQLHSAIKSEDSHRIQSASKKTALAAMKVIHQICKLAFFFDKIHAIEMSRWHVCIPTALVHTSFLTSAIPSVIGFRSSCFKIEKRGNPLSERVYLWLDTASTALYGASLYTSIFFPPILSQVLTTGSVLIDITQYFQHLSEGKRNNKGEE